MSESGSCTTATSEMTNAYCFMVNGDTGLTLWSHLLKNHMQEWVSECQKLGIVLKGTEGEEAFAQLAGLPVQC